MTTAELMLDAEAMFEAIDRKRRRLKLNRKQVAEVLGVAACTINYWGSGGRIGSDAALRASVWLNRDIRDFIKKDEAA
jgi:transcriptional regulator with XRE-family HTH domain